MTRILSATLISLAIAACGSDDTSNDVAEVGWSFNYRDFTNDAAPDDLRGCDNRPDGGNAIPPYNAITKVRVLITDPAGQVPGMDQEYDCAQGIGGDRLPVRGLVLQEYALTIEAKNATGTVLYRIVKPTWDLTSFKSESFELPTATGEFHTFPRYDGALTCPAEIVTMRYALYSKNSDGTFATTPVASGVLSPACEQGFSGYTSLELIIREVPVTIANGTFQTYNAFRMAVAALNGSDQVLYCATDTNRTVRPGNDSLGGDLTMLSATSCD